MSSIYLLVLKPKNISFLLLRFNLASAPSSFSLVFFSSCSFITTSVSLRLFCR